jgi:hypothetical protein
MQLKINLNRTELEYLKMYYEECVDSARTIEGRVVLNTVFELISQAKEQNKQTAKKQEILVFNPS